MSFAPVIFESADAFEQAVEIATGALRRADAARFGVLADDYEKQALKEGQFSYAAGELEGIAGGLRIAAALLTNEAEVAA